MSTRAGSSVARFTRAAYGSSTRRLVMSACGLEGAGKTDFSLTAPDPIYVFAIDPNLEEIVKRYQDDKAIYPKVYRVPMISTREKDEIKDLARPVWEEFLDDYQAVVEGRVDPPARTIVLDTASEFRQLQMLGAFGKAIQVPKELYTPINAVWRDLIAAAKQTSLNVIFLHRLGPKYARTTVRVKGGGTEERSEKIEGEYERKGFSETGYLVQAEVFLWFDPAREGGLGEQFGLRVMRCTQRPTLIGEEWWGTLGRAKTRMASFGWLASQVFPETDPDDWT